MKLIRVYECLCDQTRLRIIHLLQSGPLCVCHLQAILDEPQVKVSKHLRYLKTRGLVASRVEGNWRIYRLFATPARELEANLRCLQDCAGEDPVFRRDAAKLARLRQRLENDCAACAPAAVFSPQKSRP
jgi:ArsR family transcriptional regulator